VKPKKTVSHTGGATDGYSVRKTSKDAVPDPNGNRAERRAAQREARKSK
jgi:hypothetical protein